MFLYFKKNGYSIFKCCINYYKKALQYKLVLKCYILPVHLTPLSVS